MRPGAKTRWSAILHGVWLLLLVGAFTQVLTLIPVSVLAAILVYTGAKLAHPKVIKQLKRYGRGEVVIFVVTTAAVVGTDLLTGVLIGFGLAVGKLLLQLSKLQVRVRDDPKSNRTVIELVGSATFLGLANVADTLNSVEPSRELHLHIEQLDHVDHAVLELFQSWADQHRDRGGSVVVDWERFERRYHFRPRTNDAKKRAAA